MKGSQPKKNIKFLVLTLYSRFLPLFYILESSLKNRIFKVIEDELSKSWFLTQLDNANNDPLFRTEISLILNRKPRNYQLSPEKLVVESGLGLWVEFFSPRVYKLAKGRPIKIFPYLPKNIKRSDIYQRLMKIKDFRNLLVHSRVPIINDEFSLNYLNEIQENYKTLLELLEWIGETTPLNLNQFEQEADEIRNSIKRQA
jgi:hypothetical protein